MREQEGLYDREVDEAHTFYYINIIVMLNGHNDMHSWKEYFSNLSALFPALRYNWYFILAYINIKDFYQQFLFGVSRQFIIDVLWLL